MIQHCQLNFEMLFMLLYYGILKVIWIDILSISKISVKSVFPFKQSTTRIIWQNCRDISLVLIQILYNNRLDIYFQLIQEIT